MLRYILPLFLLQCIFLSAQSESYTYVEYDTLSNGYLQMTIDKKMDDLLETKKSRCDLLEQYKREAAAKAASHSQDKPITFTDLCREHPKMRGYRIQVLNTRSSEEAEKAQRQVQTQFPSLSSQVVSRMPQFKVLLGDYYSKENAASDLTAVKRIYPGAILVVSKIWCNRAK